MRPPRHEALEFLRFAGVDPGWPLVHGCTTRAGGVSPGPWASLNLGFGSGDQPARVRENQRRACVALGLSPRHLVYMQQVHSANVAVVREPAADPVWATGQLRRLPETDAVVTAQPGIVLLARGADCPLLLLYAPDRRAVAVVHSGWRGTFANIAGRTVTTLCREFACDPARLFAGLAPCIGAAHYAVGPELVAQLPGVTAQPERFCRRQAGRWHLDLPGLIAWQLRQAGVRHVETSGRCTFADPRCFSHRRDGARTGRCGLLAALTDDWTSPAMHLSYGRQSPPTRVPVAGCRALHKRH